MDKTEVTLLLGPAGSGKTFRCTESLREELQRDPEGGALLFLAPKQATFQIETALLADSRIQGYTRLQILSFPRLAEHILSEFGGTRFQLLSDDGRIMLIRSLLNRHAETLRAFRALASFPSFGDELSNLLVELRRHQISLEHLRKLQTQASMPVSLRDKLHDLALIADHYSAWLEQADLKDPEFLLDLAIELLNTQEAPHELAPRFFVQSLWLDGFAEMTPQELALLTAVIKRCRNATLAFCVDPDHLQPTSWLNLWNTTTEVLHRLTNHLRENKISWETDLLPRRPDANRYDDAATLRHIEQHWLNPVSPTHPPADSSKEIELVSCQHREWEVVHAARQIIRFTRQHGARYRDTTLIVRHLEDYQTEIKRVFRRYQIPFFIDQRESIRHHPVVVLTRSTLRLIAFQWQPRDLFTALKSDLTNAELQAVHELESAALEFGWKGAAWAKPIPDSIPGSAGLEQLRQSLTRPFRRFEGQLPGRSHSSRGPISGIELVNALRQFWEELEVETRLRHWDQEASVNDPDNLQTTFHAATWEQLQLWLENVELAFAETHCALHDWIPILETGLSHLTVGVIPATLDQVLIGSVDRTRSHNVQLALVLGLNEGVFPTSPASPTLLTESERQALGNQFEQLVPSTKRRLAAERFYAYIAFTRSSQKLILSYAEQTPDGSPLNPSSLIAHLQRLVPSIKETSFDPNVPITDAEDISELIAPLFRSLTSEQTLPAWAQAIPALVADVPVETPLIPPSEEHLRSDLAKRLYLDQEATLRTSVSRLEQFAACPFRFFVHSGLRCEERMLYQIDRRRIGSMQHEILEAFHRELQAEKKLWRDVPVPEARERIERLAKEHAPKFNQGLFQASDEAAFSLETIVHRLQEFVSILIDWMDQYAFDPVAVELGFGGRDDSVGPWTIPLEQGRMAFTGKIDRLDISRSDDSDTADVVIIDYKSGGRKLDRLLLEHGIQLQLLAYLNVVAQSPQISEHLGTKHLNPAGVFFVPLRGHAPRQPTRDEAQRTHYEFRPRAFQHVGCFDFARLRLLDTRQDASQGDQIQYQLKRDGTPKKTSWNVMPPAVFRQTMHQTEAHIHRMGNEILDGRIEVDPYQHAMVTACQYCPYKSICRIDPAAHAYRALSPSEDATVPDPE